MKVFITGASSGLGEALARHYAAPGAVLGLAARRAEALGALAASLPGTCRPYPLDVAKAGCVEASARAFLDEFGPPTLVIANAGVSLGTRGDETQDLPKLLRVLEVNVGGLAATLAAFAPALRAAGRGTLCGIASVAGFRGIPGSGALSASKAAAIAWLEALRVELLGTGVSVVTVCPGFVDTPMTRMNAFPMPFVLSAPEAARLVARAIARRRRLAVIPRSMALAALILRSLPRPVWDRLAARAPRKAR